MIAANTSRKAQFELEQRLRNDILQSPSAQRSSAVAAAYEQLFEKFPNHSVFLATEEDRQRKGRRGALMIGLLTKPGDRILEVGCGRGDVLLQLAKDGRRCVGIEPSSQMIELVEQDGDLTIEVGTAEQLQFADESFDLVFSEQVLEHLHPEDVPRHLQEAFRVLRHGGVLVVETPNARTGPQDISRGFTRIASGLHLKEWSYAELIHQFRSAGFVRLRGLLAPPFVVRRFPILHRATRVPAGLKRIEDLILTLIPGLQVRTLVARALGLNDLFLFGFKPSATVEIFQWIT